MRTTRALVVAAALVAAVGRGAAQAPPPAADWPQFRGTPRLTGTSPVAPPASLKVLWRHETGDMIDSSPAVVGGVVYVVAGNGELSAIDFATRQAALEVRRAGI